MNGFFFCFRKTWICTPEWSGGSPCAGTTSACPRTTKWWAKVNRKRRRRKKGQKVSSLTMHHSASNFAKKDSVIPSCPLIWKPNLTESNNLLHAWACSALCVLFCAHVCVLFWIVTFRFSRRRRGGRCRGRWRRRWRGWSGGGRRGERQTL